MSLMLLVKMKRHAVNIRHMTMAINKHLCCLYMWVCELGVCLSAPRALHPLPRFQAHF